MQGKIVSGWWRSSNSTRTHQQQLRLMVTSKASNRAAVHGTRLPVPDQVDKEEVAKEISKGKEERESKRKEIEKTVDSELKKTNKPYTTIE